jgi:hydroxymethylpyrimidine pyrophosphatase-like HAD family hydrolase
MRYLALAVDYDGTLATLGEVPDEAVAALERLKSSGRKVILVTGRTLDDLQRVFGRLDVFDHVVAENGGLLYRPALAEEQSLASPPPPELIAALKDRDVQPLARGRVLIGTSRPHQTAVLEAIQAVGLEYQIIFNKGAIMILPAGVNKHTGLLAALKELQLSARNVVGVGDAENDHAFLAATECAIAVANALPSIKRRADLVTRGSHSEGVIEVIDRLLEDDLAGVSSRTIHLGTEAERRKRVRLPAYGSGLLVAGSPKAGKSSLVLGLVEAIGAHGYQYCLIDPEGDHERLPRTINLGDAQQAPTIQEVRDALAEPAHNVCVSMLSVRAEERPLYFADLLRGMSMLQASTGRPHWLVVDEAHHVLPNASSTTEETLAWQTGGLVLVTIGPRRLAPAVQHLLTHVCAVGKDPNGSLAAAGELLGERAPRVTSRDLDTGQGIVWQRGQKQALLVDLVRSKTKRRRHRRKDAVSNAVLS